MTAQHTAKLVVSLTALLTLTACPPPDDGGIGRLADTPSHPAATLPGSGGIDAAAGVPEVGLGACRVRRFAPSERITDRIYDREGRLASEVRSYAGSAPHQTTTYERDAAHRIVERSIKTSNSVYTTTFKRDEQGRVTAAHRDQLGAAEYTYTYTDDLLAHITHVDAGVVLSEWQFDYTTDGRLSRKTITRSFGDFVVDYKYDDAGRLSRKFVSSDETQSEEQFNWVDGLLRHIDYPVTNERATYHHDRDGRVVSMVRTVEGKQVEEVLYDYDCEAAQGS